MDIAGPIPKARQCLDLVEFTVLASDVHVPAGFVDRATPTVVPYTSVPGSKTGYYMVKMTGESRCVPDPAAPKEVEIQELDDMDLVPSDFEEVIEPKLSEFAEDSKAMDERQAKETSERATGLLKAMQLKAKSELASSQAST